jgi:predicted secreted protein
MKFIKKFENFINDFNRESDSTSLVPAYNAANNLGAENWVEILFNVKDFDYLEKIAKMDQNNAEERKPDDDSSPEDFERYFDKLREKAIQYFKDNPSEIKNQYEPTADIPSGDGIP